MIGIALQHVLNTNKKRAQSLFVCFKLLAFDQVNAKTGILLFYNLKRRVTFFIGQQPTDSICLISVMKT